MALSDHRLKQNKIHRLKQNAISRVVLKAMFGWYKNLTFQKSVTFVGEFIQHNYTCNNKL